VSVYFFDTSALKFRYVSGPRARGVRRVSSDARNTCYVAELTILEIANALGSMYRDNRIALPDVRRADLAFWGDIQSGRLKVWPTRRKDMMRARHLLLYAGVQLGRSIDASDALIAAASVECALEMKTKVTLCLEDRRLHSTIKALPAYRAVLRLYYIGR